MPFTPSPLRYPGGKTQLYHYVRKILECNGLLQQTYVEPFAGGAGLAIKLLLNEDVNHIIINDYDEAIYALWFSILNNTEQFCDLISNTDVTVDEWHRQRAIYQNPYGIDHLRLGFATFFLNRTNVSGVIKGGVIGGVNQNGTFQLDARYNKAGLITRICDIAAVKEKITLSNLDVFDFLHSDILRSKRRTLINFDPPYVSKGSQLYKNSFCEGDHIRLSREIKACTRKWIVTYDICPLIARLYKKYRCDLLNINYSIGSVREAREYIFYGHNLCIPAVKEETAVAANA